MVENKQLTDSQKLQIIHNSRKRSKKWAKLSREKKLEILEGMDIGTDEKWLTALFEDAEE